jgi:hypothetical protein
VVEYPPLTTFDADVALTSRLEANEQDIRERLVANGFRKEFLGDHQPPATHYRLGDAKSGFYAELLTPLTGSRYDRKGTAKATGRVGGVTTQKEAAGSAGWIEDRSLTSLQQRLLKTYGRLVKHPLY